MWSGKDEDSKAKNATQDAHTTKEQAAKSHNVPLTGDINSVYGCPF
jgi:hypothetical protein